MSRFIRHKKKDSNHGEIIDFFRKAGATVDDVSDLAGLGYDLVVGYGAGTAHQVVLVEIKDGAKPPSKRKLTDSEEAAKARWGEKFAVVATVEEARGLLSNMAQYAALMRRA